MSDTQLPQGDPKGQDSGVHAPHSGPTGAPTPMADRPDTASTDDARTFAAELGAASGLPGRLVDERLSPVTAHAVLRGAGRSQRSSRRIVDQVAAVVLPQQAIDVEKGTGTPAGEPSPDPQEPA